MTYELFAAELKKQRLDRQVSLMDISAATRINIKFLEALEEGNFSVLPQTYIRAFIREYAEAVGYDVRDAMKKYEVIRAATTSPKTPVPDIPARPVVSLVAPERSQLVGKLFAYTQQNTVFVAVIALAVLFLVYLLRPTSETRRGSEVAETPFDKVVQESEAAVPKKEDPVPLPVVARPQPTDSLLLEMTTSDSVWIMITLDGAKTLEYLFSASRKESWKAKERFSLTLGNAGGATFSLNGKSIGALGKPGSVVRNYLLTRGNIPKQ